ncbi:MAG: methyltransferase domain-containing protein [Silvibacterium sp.]
MSQTQENGLSQPKYWARLAVFLLCALAVAISLNVGAQALNTLNRLDVIEAERDHWQRPSEVIRALNLKQGETVLDLGCGSGYFSLKLSESVGPNGKVIAEDIRRLSLAFLWMRTLRRGKHNIRVLHAEVDDPHLAPNSVNAVLISNTYHEFTAPGRIMDRVRQSLLPGGRVVIVDRWPRDPREQPAVALQEHEISPEQVQADLHKAMFEIDSRMDHFIEDDPEHENWWMIVAHRPPGGNPEGLGRIRTNAR